MINDFEFTSVLWHGYCYRIYTKQSPRIRIKEDGKRVVFALRDLIGKRNSCAKLSNGHLHLGKEARAFQEANSGTPRQVIYDAMQLPLLLCQLLGGKQRGSARCLQV